MAQKGLWNLARDKTLQDRGACKGDVITEYNAMHEENFLSRWLREDVEGTEERKKKLNRETKEEEQKEGKRRGERRGPNGCG